MKKKIVSMLALTVVMIMTSATSVLAHGHHGSKRTTTKHNVCSVADCILTGTHKHKNKTNYYYGDGHEYHEICGVLECMVIIEE